MNQKTVYQKEPGTDPGTAFKNEKFKTFCKENFIEHVICPVRDHRGNGKVERMIRTINERLRTNTKEKNGIQKQVKCQKAKERQVRQKR